MTTTKKAKSGMGKLSFVAPRDGKTLPKRKADQWPFCFWHVTNTSDSEDSNLGQRYAIEYLNFEEAEGSADGGFLQNIVGDMPRPLTMVEIAFLQLVSFAAAKGAWRARQIAKYWDECNAQPENVAADKAAAKHRERRRRRA
jgi:hypothetical protein